MNINNCLTKDLETALCALLKEDDLMQDPTVMKICQKKQKAEKREKAEKAEKPEVDVSTDDVVKSIEGLEDLTDIGKHYLKRWKDWDLSADEIKKIKGWQNLYKKWGYRTINIDHEDKHQRYEAESHTTDGKYALQKYTDPFFRSLQQVHHKGYLWTYIEEEFILDKYSLLPFSNYNDSEGKKDEATDFFR